MVKPLNQDPDVTVTIHGATNPRAQQDNGKTIEEKEI
jgi:hypothetical protein